MMQPAPPVHISFLANRLRQVVNNMEHEASGKNSERLLSLIGLVGSESEASRPAQLGKDRLERLWEIAPETSVATHRDGIPRAVEAKQSDIGVSATAITQIRTIQIRTEIRSSR